ncbi:MAG: tungstate ABC transporter substrate-binding protein WtpA [Desulfosudaceae bacterium]
MRIFWFGIVCLVGLVLVSGISVSGISVVSAAERELVIFHAGSLAVPLTEMEKRFEALYPDIDIQRETGGSTKMARLISEVGKPADIMAAADYKVIDNNLIPDHAKWNIRFATNQLVLTYTENSRYADQIKADNWYRILQKKDVVWGHADPNLDPCGYRSLMVLQLAEKFYGIAGLYEDLLANRPLKNVRPKSVELVNLLKSGHMDYAWEYLSVAEQHDLKYLTLDDHINLGDYRYDDFYRQASVRVTGRKPGTFISKKGQSVTYGVTMTDDAPNPDDAVLFLEFMLDPEQGLKILESMGQPPLIPARISDQTMLRAMPEPLRNLVEVEQ